MRLNTRLAKRDPRLQVLNPNCSASVREVAGLRRTRIICGELISAAGQLRLNQKRARKSKAEIIGPLLLETLIRDRRIRWADSLSFGPDGSLYIADSAIPKIALRSRAQIEAAAPYHLFRAKTGASAPAGH